ncbi:MAG: DUF4249 family protein [Bacteroidota bacterium]
MTRIIRNKYFAVALTGIVSGFFMSCEKIIEPKDLPQQDARIVVNSILVTDHFISAEISSSKSILNGKPYTYIDNAVCEIYENGVFKQNLLSAGNGTYISATLAKQNTKYTIKVSAAGYKTVEGSTSLLGGVSVTGIERYDTASANYFLSDFGNNTFNINGSTKYRLKIVDDLAVKNFYSIRPLVLLFDSAGNEITNEPSNASIINNISGDGIFGGGGGYNNGLTVEYDDLNLVNGKEVPVDVSVSLSFSSFSTKVSRIEVYFEVYNLNEDYYKYKTSLNDQLNTGGLFAEPVRVYSNISSGMGIIAGASVSTFSAYSGTPKKQ